MSKISDYVSIKSEFTPVIDLMQLKTNDIDKKLLKDYITTPHLVEKLFDTVLLDFAKSGGDSNSVPNILLGVYGTGKSYALIIFNYLLSNPDNIEIFKDKIDKEQIDDDKIKSVFNSLEIIKNKKYITLSCDISQYNKIEFNDIIVGLISNNLPDKLPMKFIKSRVEKALKHIENMPYDSKLIFEKHLASEYGINIEQLKLELIHTSGEGIKKYENINEKAWGDFNKNLNISLSTILSDLSEELRDSDYHLVIQLDELSSYLLYWSENNQEFLNILAQLQGFAEFCKNKVNRISLVGVMHTNTKNLETRLPEEHFDTLQKVMGRFNVLTIESFNFNRMLTNVLQRDVNDIKTIIDKQIDSYQKRQLNEISAITNINFYESFPFHPYTIYLLPLLSTKLGQYERTNFGFITYYYKSFSDEPLFEGTNLTTIKPHHIFEYFEDDLKNSNDNYYAIYNESWQIAKNIYLGQEILQTLLIIYLSSTIRLGQGSKVESIENGLPLERLAMILQANTKVVENSLKQLLGCNYVFYNDQNGIYSFIVSDNANPNKILKDVNEETLSIEKKITDEALLKEIYNITRFSDGDYIFNPVERHFKYQICFIKETQNNLYGADERNYLGKILFILPNKEDTGNYTEQVHTLVESKDLSDKSIRNILILFKIDKFSYKEIYKILSIKKLLLEKKYDSEYSKALLGRLLAQAMELVKQSFATIMSHPNYNMFWNGSLNENTYESIRFEVDKKVNFRFPKMQMDYLKKGIATKLIKNFITNGKYYGTSAEIVKLITKFMHPLGLAIYSSDNNGYLNASLNQPSENDKESFLIWTLIQNWVKSKEVSIEKIFDMLIKQPYGLTDEIILIYISVLVKLGKLVILNKTTTKRITDVNEEILKDLNRYKDNLYILLDFSDIDPIEYTTFANGLYGGLTKNKKLNPEILTAADAKELIEQVIPMIISKIENVVTKYGMQSVDTAKLSEILNRFIDLDKQKKNTGEYLQKVKEIDNLIKYDNLVSIESFIELLDYLTDNIESVSLGHIILTMKKNDLVNYEQYSKLKERLEMLEVLYLEFSLNPMLQKNLESLLICLKEFITEYESIFNREHKEYNVLKQHYYDRFVNCEKYKIYKLIQKYDTYSNSLVTRYINSLSTCETVIELDYINMIWPQCTNNNCQYKIGMIKDARNDFEIDFTTHVSILDTLINDYISNITKLIDKETDTISKDVQTLKSFKEKALVTDNEKLDFIIKTSNILPSESLVREESIASKQLIIGKVDLLKDMINNAAINNLNDVISIIFTWLNSNIRNCWGKNND